MARGASRKPPSRPHAGDRRLAGLVHRSVRPQQVPTALVGGGGGGKVSGGGGGKPRFTQGANAKTFKRFKSEKLEKEHDRTGKAIASIRERLNRASKNPKINAGDPSPSKPISSAHKRRLGRRARSLRQRLEEIDSGTLDD